MKFILTLTTLLSIASHAMDYTLRADVNSNVISKTLGEPVHFTMCNAAGMCSQTYTMTTSMLHNKMYYYNFTSNIASPTRINLFMEKTTTLVCFDRVWVSGGLGTVEIGVLNGCLDQDTFTNTSCTMVELDFGVAKTYKPMYHIDPCNFTTANATMLTSWKEAALVTPTPAPYPVTPISNAVGSVAIAIKVDSNMAASNGQAPVYFHICTRNDAWCTAPYKIMDAWVPSWTYTYDVMPSNATAFLNISDVWTVNLWITDMNTQVCVDRVTVTVRGQSTFQRVAITGCMGSVTNISHNPTPVLPNGGCSFLTVDISSTKVYTGHHVFTKWFTTSENATTCPSIVGAVPLRIATTNAPSGMPTSNPTSAPVAAAPTSQAFCMRAGRLWGIIFAVVLGRVMA